MSRSPTYLSTVAQLRFDRARIEAFLARAVERLEGEWLLVGGAAAAAWFSPSRTSEDIDLVALAGSNAQRLALMNLAAELAIPIEAVNSAADFFLAKIEGWRHELVVLARGPQATIYRPNATLFFLLKVRRLSAVDLEDCLGLIATGDRPDSERVKAAIDALPETLDEALRERRAALRTAVDEPR